MKPILLLQALDDRVRENRKNLVCRSLNQNLITAFSDAGLQLLGQVIRMSRDLEIQIVTKQFKELQAHRSSLGQKSAALSQVVAKVILELRIHNHNCLSNQGAILRPADIKHVDEFCDGFRAKIASPGSQRRAKSRSIKIKMKALRLTFLGKGGCLGAGINSPKLGGLYEVQSP